MIFLTKIEFQSNINTFKFLSEKNLQYKLHQLIEKLQESESAHNRILWRYEEPKDIMPYILVQTNFKPNVERLKSEDISKCLKDICAPKFAKPSLQKGEKFIFKIRANPTKKLNKSRKRVPLKTEDDLKEWLKNKSAAHGFSVLESDFFREEILKFEENVKFTGAFCFNSVLFSGVLQIEDSQKFIDTLQNGIGSAKGFGFGLLSIKRI